MTEYESYALRRDALVISKFVSKIATHREKLALHKMDPSRYEFPRPVSKNAKWPAYEAAGRIVRTLELDMHASSVPDLARVLAVAMEAIL